MALVSSYERLKETAEIAANSLNAAQLQYLKTLDSIEAKQQQLQTSMQSLYTSTGIQNFYKGLIDLANGIVKSFTDMPTIFSLPIPAILKFGTTFYSLARIVTTVLNSIKNEFVAQQQQINVVLVLGTRLEGQRLIDITRATLLEKLRIRQEAALKARMIQEGMELGSTGLTKEQKASYGKWSKIASLVGIAGTMLSAAPQASNEVKAVGSIIGGMGNFAGIGMALGSAIPGIGTVAGGIGGAIIGALSGLPEAIDLIVETAEEKVERFNQQITDANNKKLISENEFKTLTDYQKRMDSLNESAKEGNDVKALQVALNAEIAASYPELIKGIDELGNIIVDLTNKYKELKKNKQAAYAKDIIESGKQQLTAASDTDWIWKQLGLSQLQVNKSNDTTTNLAGSILNNSKVADYMAQVSSLNATKETKGRDVLSILGYNRDLDYLDIDTNIKLIIDKLKSADMFVDDIYADNGQVMVRYFAEALYGYLSSHPDLVVGLVIESLLLSNTPSLLVNQSLKINTYKENFINGIITSSIAQLRQSYDAIWDKLNKVSGLAGTYMNKQLLDSYEAYAKYRKSQGDTEDKIWENWSKGTISEEDAKTYRGMYSSYDLARKIIYDSTNKAFEELDEYYQDIGNLTIKQYNKIANKYSKDPKAKEAWDTFEAEFTQVRELADKIFHLAIGRSVYYEYSANTKKRIASLKNKDNINLERFTDVLEGHGEESINSILNIIESGTTDSISGIEDIIKKYGETFNINPKTDYSVFVQIMRLFEDTVRINFNTEYQVLAESYTSHLKEFDKALKNATSGMGYEDAVALANQLGVTLGQFQQREGKFYLDDLNLIKNKLMPGQDGLKQVLLNRAKVVEQVFDENGDIIPAWLELQTEEALAAWPNELRQIYSAIQGFKNSGKDKTLEGWRAYIALLLSNFNKLDKATQYIIQSNWLSTGNLEKFLESVKDDSAKNINESELYTKALKGELTGELAQFSQQIIELYQKNTKAVYDAVTNLISGLSISESVIVTDTNRELLEKILGDSLESKIGQVVQITAEKAAGNFDETLYSLLGDQSYSWKDRIEAAGKLWEGAFSSSNFRLDALKSAINSSFQDLDFATWGALPDSIRTLADYNTTTGKFFMSLNLAAQVINAQSLIDEGFTKQEANELIATLRKNTREKDIKTIASELVKNRESLTEENIASIATALGQTYDDVIATLQLQRNQDGTYRMNMNSILQLMNQKQGLLDTVLALMIAEEIDNIIGNVSNIASNQGKGVTSYAEMQKAASRAQQAGFDVDISNLYEWNDTIHGFVLSAEGILVEVARARMELENLNEENKDARSFLELQINSMGRELANNIDLNAFMLAENRGEGSLAAKNLTKSVQDYNKYLLAIGSKIRINAEILMQQLEKGGVLALDALQTIAVRQGKLLSDSDVRNAFRFRAEQLLTAAQELDSDVGSIISASTAKLLLQTTSAKLQQLGPNSYRVLEAAEDLTAAFSQLYALLSTSGAATLSELNNIVASYFKATYKSAQNDLVSKLGNVASMTWDLLASIFTEAGLLMREALSTDLSKILVAENGKVKVTNFESFANALGINTNSPEYLEAFKSYNDALIKESQFVEKTINDELNNLVKAKPGDLINISGLYTKVGDMLEVELMTAGVLFNNGIVKITEATNLPALIQSIESAAASQGLILESDVQALIDAVQALFKGLADSITKGIQGTLSKTEAMDLQSSARNLLPGFKGDLKFTQTYNGLKLSTDQAIKLYDAMKGVDAVSSHIVFDSLTKLLTKAGEACESMSRAMAEIARLEDKVRQSTGDARKEAEKQLAVYKLIANTQIQNPESYDWMNRDLPDYLKGPENYWNSLGTAFKALNEAAKEAEEGSTKAAHMLDPTDFYNMVNEFNNIAQLSGTEINFLGHKLNGDMTSAAKLIEEGMRTLSNVDGDGVKVDLTKFGANFTGGAEGMAKGVHEGIKAMAESQIEMLDGMIQLLETVVAMEGLKDIAGTDNKIDLTDLFPEFTADTDKLTAYDDVKIWAKKLLDDTANTDLQKALDNIVINGESLRTTLSKLNKGYAFSEKEAKEVQNKLNALYQMYLSGDYSLLNLIGSIKLVFASSGFEGDVKVGDQTFYISQGYVLEKGETGWKVPGGGEYSDFNEALARFKLSEEQGITQSAAVYDAKNKTASAPLKVGTQTILITSSIEGKNTYSIVGYPIDKKFTSRNLALWLAFKLELAQQENKGAKFSGKTEERFKKWLVQSKVEILSLIEVTNLQLLKTATHEQIVNLAQALVSGKEEDIEVAAGKIGIKYDVTGLGISQADFEKLATTAGIDTKTLALSLATEVVGDNAENVKKILANLPLSATVDLTGNLTNLDGTLNTLTYNEQVSVTLANIKAMATAESINWDGITALINTVPEDKRPTVEAQAKLYIIKALEGNPEYQGFPALLTGLQGLPIPALQATATVMSILWGGGANVTNATGLTQDLINALAATLDLPDTMLEALATLVQITDGGVVPEESAELATKLSQLFPDGKYTTNDIKAITLAATAAAVMINGKGVTATGEFDDSYKTTNGIAQVTADIIKLIVSTNASTTTEEGTTFNADNWQGTVDKIYAIAALLEVGLQNEADINVDGTNIPSNVATTKTIEALRASAAVLSVIFQKDPTGKNINVEEVDRVIAELVDLGKIQASDIESIKAIVSKLLLNTADGNPLSIDNLNDILPLDKDNVIDLGTFKSKITILSPEILSDFFDYGFETEEELTADIKALSQRYQLLYNEYKSNFNDRTEAENLAMRENLNKIWSDRNAKILRKNSLNTPIEDAESAPIPINPTYLSKIAELSNIAIALHDNLKEVSGQDDYELEQMIENLNTSVRNYNNDALRNETTESALQKAIEDLLTYISQLYPNAQIPSVTETNNIPEEQRLESLNSQIFKWLEENNLSQEFTTWINEQELEVPDNILDDFKQTIQEFSKWLAQQDTTTQESFNNENINLNYDDSSITNLLLNLEKLSSSAETTETTVDTLTEALSEIPTEASLQVETFANAAATAGEEGASSASDISAGARNASAAVSRFVGNLSRIPNNKTVAIDLEITAKENNNAAAVVKGTIDGKPFTTNTPLRIGLASATGNAAAQGKTLVGLLGPELVVSNGRYYLVGQAGALMVSLPDDAIVFNHLQTQNLLKKERGGGRGKPVTNERNAVAFAKGTGPAMASASAALAALKQIRAMWQSMLGATMKDLGSLAGQEAGKASSGGGGGGSNDPEQVKAVVALIERWYNLLRQINRLQKEITYEENLQAEIESGRLANGKARYNSYKREIEYLDEEIVRNQQLADLQKSWYERKRQELVNSDYGKIFTYDENGQLQYRQGVNRGLDVLETLTRRDIYGQTTGASTNAQTQINYLRSIGFNTLKLKYNDDGTVLSESDYEDNPEQIYVDMMLNFWDNLDGWKDELDGIYDSYQDQLNNVLTNLTKRNQLLQKIIDNQLSVEQDVLKAIESREQKLIDELQDERDALEKSNKDFIDGLTDQLNQLKQMYQNAESEKELFKLRRQVAILLRSGGSASQIRSLQEQIAAKEQDQYFTAQEQQIAAIQKASDLQIERMDSQIDLMTKTLEYQKLHGLLWEEVYQIMAATPLQIRQFITENTPDFQSASALDVAEKIRDIDLRINEWIGYRDDETAPSMTGDRYYDWDSYSAARTEVYGNRASDLLKNQAKAEFDRILLETGDINAAGAAADAIFRAVLGDRPGLGDIKDDIIDSIATNITNKINGDVSNITKPNNYSSRDYDYGSNYNYNRNNNKTTTNKNTSTTDSKKTSWTFGASEVGQGTLIADMLRLQNEINTGYAYGLDSTTSSDMKKREEEFNKKYDLLNVKNRKQFNKYASGGLVDYTGLAQVDGTPQRPEAFINAEQTQMLRNYLFGGSDSLLSLAQQIVQQMHGTSSGLNTNNITEQSGLNIEKIDVNVNVDRVANDYDVRQIGGKVMDEILTIARKSGTRGLSRR